MVTAKSSVATGLADFSASTIARQREIGFGETGGGDDRFSHTTAVTQSPAEARTMPPLRPPQRGQAEGMSTPDLHPRHMFPLNRRPPPALCPMCPLCFCCSRRRRAVDHAPAVSRALGRATVRVRIGAVPAERIVAAGPATRTRNGSAQAGSGVAVLVGGARRGGAAGHALGLGTQIRRGPRPEGLAGRAGCLLTVAVATLLAVRAEQGAATGRARPGRWRSPGAFHPGAPTVFIGPALAGRRWWQLRARCCLWASARRLARGILCACVFGGRGRAADAERACQYERQLDLHSPCSSSEC
jgi:hypothetical protein